jgi:hypothetical protein
MAPRAQTRGNGEVATKRISKHFFADKALDTKIDVAVALFNELHPTSPDKKTMQDFVRWCVERGIDEVHAAKKAGKNLG